MSTNANPPEIELVAGDIGDKRIVECTGVEDLTWVVDVIAVVWNDTHAEVELEATVTDADNRLVEIDFGDADGWLPTADPDSYRLRIHCSSPTAELTFPVRREDQIAVIVSS